VLSVIGQTNEKTAISKFLADHPEANLYVLRTPFAKFRLGFALSDQSK
jgi:hypothetical protein